MPTPITLPSIEVFLKLAIREDQSIDLPDHETGLAIIDADPNERLCHVEFPTASNLIRKPQLWPIKEWRLAEERIRVFREKNEHDKMLIENLKKNIKIVAQAVSDIIYEGIRAPDECEDLAKQILNTKPKSVKAILKVDLVVPYYLKVFEVLPDRTERKY